MNLQILMTRFLAAGMLLCASMCGCGEEDNNYLRVEGVVTDATMVENDGTGYQVNDTLFIDTNVPFEFSDNSNYTNVTQINGLDENMPFIFQLVLHKETQFGDDVRINVAPENIVAIDGQTTFEYQSFLLTTVPEIDHFKHRFGIILKEPGTYNLQSYSSNPDYLMAYHRNGFATSLTLYSVLRSSATASNFSFTVNP